MKTSLDKKIKSLSNSDSISVSDAIALCRGYCSYIVYSKSNSISKKIIGDIESSKYIREDSVLIKMPDGGNIALTIVRDKKIGRPQPVVLMFNIYAGHDAGACKDAVQYGYTGIIANTRGKRLSTDIIEPFEHDAYDAYYIIDWISKQPWCNGKVGMYGGSYLGFSQWATAKHLHPALKTIVPQVSVGAGIDYPMENGVFMSYMLRWIHFVTDNKLTNDGDFRDDAKWESVYNNYYTKGTSFRSLDQVEGRKNNIFQRWLNHPSYDSFWQNMTPQKTEFAKINIPIFTTTGYWDDDQLGAMYYYRQYHLWNKNPNYYLLIGPYDHGGSQGYPKPEMGNYKIDSVANIPIMNIVFKWFDHVMKDSSLPAILKDKVNFEVMGSNKWRHVPSLDKMHNDSIVFYLGNKMNDKRYALLEKRPTAGFIHQEVDLANRKETDFYNGGDISAFEKIIDSSLKLRRDQLVFVSEPINKPFAISGSYAASIMASINKKDIDLAIELYEQTPDGKFMALSETMQRASYARDRSKRQLLQPGKIETINFNNTFITSRQLQKGSRIVVVMGINKNPSWQINYGTGKDVSDETIKDAAIPFDIKWYNSSYINIPILR